MHPLNVARAGDLKRQQCEEELEKMAARSEDLKIELQRLEAELEEKRRAMPVEVVVVEDCIVDEAVEGTADPLSFVGGWSAVSQVENAIIQLGFV